MWVDEASKFVERIAPANSWRKAHIRVVSL